MVNVQDLIPELSGVPVVVTDAYQARSAEIAAQYLRFTAISGDLGCFIADISPNTAINLYIGARVEGHHRHRQEPGRPEIRTSGQLRAKHCCGYREMCVTQVGAEAIHWSSINEPLYFPRANLLKIYPDLWGSLQSSDPTTAGAETRCQEWLETLMTSGPKKQSKSDYYKDAKQFEIGLRAFDRAWAKAIENTGATAWKHAGRRSDR